MKKFSKVTAREVLENFQSDSEYGLSNAAVSSLKKIHGTNKIAEEEKVINSSPITTRRLINHNILTGAYSSTIC